SSKLHNSSSSEQGTGGREQGAGMRDEIQVIRICAAILFEGVPGNATNLEVARRAGGREKVDGEPERPGRPQCEAEVSRWWDAWPAGAPRARVRTLRSSRLACSFIPVRPGP